MNWIKLSRKYVHDTTMDANLSLQVYAVEEEMRELLKENEASKRAMEEKVKRLTHAMADIQSDLL